MEHAISPYDLAYEKLGFHQPAIRVASCEGDRQTYPWNKAFEEKFDDRLKKHLDAITAPRPQL
jgi:hypothetical protein